MVSLRRKMRLARAEESRAWRPEVKAKNVREITPETGRVEGALRPGSEPEAEVGIMMDPKPESLLSKVRKKAKKVASKRKKGGA